MAARMTTPPALFCGFALTLRTIEFHACKYVMVPAGSSELGGQITGILLGVPYVVMDELSIHQR